MSAFVYFNIPNIYDTYIFFKQKYNNINGKLVFFQGFWNTGEEY